MDYDYAMNISSQRIGNNWRNFSTGRLICRTLKFLETLTFNGIHCKLITAQIMKCEKIKNWFIIVYFVYKSFDFEKEEIYVTVC